MGIKIESGTTCIGPLKLDKKGKVSEQNLPATSTATLLNVAVSASHVTLSCDCGKISVVYSRIDHINTTQLSSPILSCNISTNTIMHKKWTGHHWAIY